VAEIDAAKRLLKKGKVAAALKRIERVLTDDPSNQKALQLKANALRREGRFADSTQIYRLLLNHEDFDTRLGFTYALFSEGNRLAAQASADRLVPDDDSDHEELQDLRRSFTQSYRPHLSTGCDWYSDTDANQTRKCSLLSTFWLGNWKLGASYQQTEARNPESVRTADAVVFQSSRSVGEQFKLSGDFGLQTLSSGIRFPMHFRAEGQLRGAHVTAQLLQDIPTATVQLIENRIRVDGVGLTVSDNPFDRVATSVNYVHRYYSDLNNSDDLKMSSLFTIMSEPLEAALGYRFRYLDFERQTKHGYFDPSYFISHELVINLAFERDRYYGSLESTVGHQAFLRTHYNSGISGAAAINVGVRVGKHLSLEMNGEGGNYALGSANGWEYYLAGTRLIFSF